MCNFPAKNGCNRKRGDGRCKYGMVGKKIRLAIKDTEEAKEKNDKNRGRWWERMQRKEERGNERIKKMEEERRYRNRV